MYKSIPYFKFFMRAIKSSVKDKKRHTAVYKAVVYFDGVVKLAKALKVHYQNVTKWLYKIEPIPIKHAVQIEYLTDGEIKASELRPDVFKKGTTLN